MNSMHHNRRLWMRTKCHAFYRLVGYYSSLTDNTFAQCEVYILLCTYVNSIRNPEIEIKRYIEN